MNGQPRVRTYLQGEMDEPDVVRFGIGTVALVSSRSPIKDTPNEDAAAIIPYDRESGVLVVADGVGGSQGGEMASRLAVTALMQTVGQAAHDHRPLRDAILNGIERANQLVLELGTRSATTLAVVEIQGSRVRPYHVGDSMILVTGQRGRIKLQTISHSPIGYAVESGMLEEEEAVHHEDRHLVSNVVGMTDMRVEIGSELTLAPRDTLVLASDGLFDNFLVEDIIEHVRRGRVAGAAERLALECRRRMDTPDAAHPSKPDDLTFLLYRQTPPTH